MIVVPATAHGQTLDTRGSTIATGLFDVYSLAECATTGLAAQVKEYQLPNGPCVDTPPIPISRQHPCCRSAQVCREESLRVSSAISMYLRGQDAPETIWGLRVRLKIIGLVRRY